MVEGRRAYGLVLGLNLVMVEGQRAYDMAGGGGLGALGARLIFGDCPCCS